jgi:hypothetical protein
MVVGMGDLESQLGWTLTIGAGVNSESADDSAPALPRFRPSDMLALEPVANGGDVRLRISLQLIGRELQTCETFSLLVAWPSDRLAKPDGAMGMAFSPATNPVVEYPCRC